MWLREKVLNKLQYHCGSGVVGGQLTLKANCMQKKTKN